MKQTLFTLLLLSAIGFVSCRKSGSEPDIKQYDQQQIQQYIAANNITGMQSVPSSDTTGIWYKIIDRGDTTRSADYPDEIAFVYTLRSFDGKFIAADTVLNHFDGFLGHAAPNGFMLAIHNLLKYRGSKMRVLIPSHLAYGVSGVGSGSKTITSGRIAGNQCLDYTVYMISDQKAGDDPNIKINQQAAYDDLVIKNYMSANSLSGYLQTADGLYYKILKQGNPDSVISNNSSVTCNYVGKLMNNTVFDDHSTTILTFPDLVGGTSPGFAEGLKLIHGGGNISLLVPSRLAYGAVAQGSIPANACLRFDISNVVVTNYY
jgi:FKBP-type peptidyl-prolyl cis-trans isomerase FkpA